MFHRGTFRVVGLTGPRRIIQVARSIGPRSLLRPCTLVGYDVHKHPSVAGCFGLTIDDAPCRPGGRPMLNEVRQLLERYQAKATFFLMTDSVPGHEEAIVELLHAGNEIANHCRVDRPYCHDSAEDFEEALLHSEDICQRLRESAGVLPPMQRLFRAPHTQVSDTMHEVLHRLGFTNVLCDCYTNDPWIRDAGFIAKNLLSQVQPGSIVVIHMPEHGFREWNLAALERFLEVVAERGLKPVTVSDLQRRAALQVIDDASDASLASADSVLSHVQSASVPGNLFL